MNHIKHILYLASFGIIFLVFSSVTLGTKPYSFQELCELIGQKPNDTQMAEFMKKRKMKPGAFGEAFYQTKNFELTFHWEDESDRNSRINAIIIDDQSEMGLPFSLKWDLTVEEIQTLVTDNVQCKFEDASDKYVIWNSTVKSKEIRFLFWPGNFLRLEI